ncbi:MAG: DUF6266 family protein [Bacteroidota bacterium]
MARLKKGILGPISGKLGPVIGATWKGIPYLRQASEKPLRERSEAQLANEGKFKFINDWLVPFHPFLGIGFQNLAVGKTAIAAAMSANYKTAFSGVFPDIEVRYAEFQISAGPLAPPAGVQAVFVAEDQISMSWSQNYKPGAAYNDQLMLVLYSEALGLTDGFVGAVNRAVEHYTFKINPRLIGQPLHAYVSMTSMSRTLIADSIYLGIIQAL